MAFTSLPGQVFSGKLVQVMPTIAKRSWLPVRRWWVALSRR